MNGIALRSDGVTVIEGTDITTDAIIDLFLGGSTIVDICTEIYPDLSDDEVERAIRYECCRTCKCDECAWARELGQQPGEPS